MFVGFTKLIIGGGYDTQNSDYKSWMRRWRASQFLEAAGCSYIFQWVCVFYIYCLEFVFGGGGGVGGEGFEVYFELKDEP